MQGWKIQDWKMTENSARLEFDGLAMCVTVRMKVAVANVKMKLHAAIQFFKLHVFIAIAYTV